MPKHKITTEALRECISTRPDYTQQQIANHFGCARETILRRIKKDKIPYFNKWGLSLVKFHKELKRLKDDG